MKRMVVSLMGALALGATLALASAASARGSTMLEFDTMAPVTGAFVGGTNPIRGIGGGGLPWQIASAEGELKANGELELTVTGLVLAEAAPVPANLRGVNPIPLFRATVSCQTTNDRGQPAVVNRTTAAFPATTGPAASGGGNAHVEAQLDLPHPCIAPIVFVNNGTGDAPGAWFAVTGAP